MAFVGVESSGELITVDNSEDSLINVEVHANVQILPGVEFAMVFWVWQFVSLQENTLRNT